MKNILILGSEGQIGAYLKEYLLKKNYKVFGFDINASKKQDLRLHNNSLLKRLIKKSDFVFFLAFDVGGSRYLSKYQNTFNFVSNNIKIMDNTFSLLKKFNKKFIFSSSQMSNMDFSNYGILKNIGEKYTTLSNGIIIKFWNVYGIEKNLSKSHVITDFIVKAKTKGNIKMLTNGFEKRDFLYVDDCCSGLYLVMKKYNQILKKKKTIDLTTGKYISIIKIAEIIKKNFSLKKKRIKIYPSKNFDKIQFKKKNKPDKFILKYWKPKFSIERGIKEIINHYL
tara:strand:+ start:214 stop:1056 length:843 start_codon:yes stop_codon:yes gene_type:complete